MRVLGFSKLFVFVLAVSVAGCGEGTESALDALGNPGTGGTTGIPDGGSPGTGGSTGTPDSGTPDTGGGAGTYQWLVIVDNETKPMCTTTGPGPDIDSVSLQRAGAAVGVGLTGSAMYMDLFSGTSGSPCTACGSMASCPNSGSAAAERVTGIRDAKSYEKMPDTGYASLNGGAIWLQIGSTMGEAPAQAIKSGDTLIVNEVDQTYINDGSAYEMCTCAPEKYSVYAYVTMGDFTTRAQLIPTAYRAANTACGETVDAKLGCGTTEFTVP